MITRERACQGKRRYNNREAAGRVAARMLEQTGTIARAYVCPFSDKKLHYHLATHQPRLTDADLKLLGEAFAKEIHKDIRKALKALAPLVAKDRESLRQERLAAEDRARVAAEEVQVLKALEVLIDRATRG